MDLTKVFGSLLAAFPVWAIFIPISGFVLKKIDDWRKEVQKELQQIRLELASSGFSTLRQDIEAAKKQDLIAEMNIKALWRAVDPEKRISDQ